MIHGIDPKIDYAFKRLFAVEHQRGRLIDLLNAVLDPPPDARIADVTILDPFNLKTYEADKLSIVDVKAIDASGRRFIVEMQMLVAHDMPRRILYYWAKAYTEQMSESMPYGDLRPATVICFLGQPLFRGMDRFHLIFDCGTPTGSWTSPTT